MVIIIIILVFCESLYEPTNQRINNRRIGRRQSIGHSRLHVLSYGFVKLSISGLVDLSQTVDLPAC